MDLPPVSENITTEWVDDHVAVLTFSRPPSNYFDPSLLERLADQYEALDVDPRCRAIVLCSVGKHFCAGARLSGHDRYRADSSQSSLYEEAIRLFQVKTPIVAALQGAAIGGGLGLALSADFRVAAVDCRLAPNFSRLGISHGFGMSVTLPRLVGAQRAAELLITGRDCTGAEALAIGLVDRAVASARVRYEALDLARSIAAAAPLAVASIRATLRASLVAEIGEAMRREWSEQKRLSGTSDAREGVAAAKERRAPLFTGS